MPDSKVIETFDYFLFLLKLQHVLLNIIILFVSNRILRLGRLNPRKITMSKNTKQKIWIVLDHPQQFATALGLVSYWRRRKFIINLIISPHTYWAKVDIDRYRNQFDNIHFFERPDYTCNPIKLLFMVYQIFRLRRKITKLIIHQNDIIVGLSVFHYLENIVLSLSPKNPKIAIMPHVVYNECRRTMDKNIYKNTFEGWLANWIVEPITGLYQTYCMKERLHPDTYWRIRYREELLNIYSDVIILGNAAGAEDHLGDKIHKMPFPYVLALGHLQKLQNGINSGNCNPQKVVFFGDAFGRGIWGVPPEVYAKHLNKCLSFLREKYSSTYKLVYRPHPTEKDEIKYLNLDQFEIENDGMLAELYLYENINRIYAVFSSGSNASRSALHFFINAYAFLDIFPYDNAGKAYFRNEMGNVPEDFYIRDLSLAPNRYIDDEAVIRAKRICENILETVLQDISKGDTDGSN